MITLHDEEYLTNEQILGLVGKIKGVIYARVSTTDQAKKGYSLESQVERCKDKAKQKYKIEEDELIVLIERGGMGDDPNRPALNHALKLLEQGLGSKFIVLHPDRLTRDNTLQGIISRKIWGMGVDIDFIEFEVDPTNPESMLMYNIQGSIAQYNKAKILANSKRGRIQKAKKEEIPSFKRLFGYKYNKTTDKLEINEEEKEVILEMVDMILNKDISCNQIAKELSRKGIQAPSGKTWYQTTVTRILRNEDYKGVYYYGKSQVVQLNGKKKQVPRPKEEWIRIPIPRIIDDVTFDLVQMKIDSFNKAKGRKSTSYLLKGLAKCGRCGSAAGSGITSKVKNGVYKYYACRMKSSKGYEVGTGRNVHVCKGRNWRVDIVDDLVWNQVKKILSNPIEIAKMFNDMSDDKDKVNQLIKQREKLEKQIEEISDEESNYIFLFGKKKINEKQFDSFVEPLKEKERAIREDLEIVISQLSNHQKNKDEVSAIQSYVEKINTVMNLDTVQMDDKRKLVNLLIKKVLLHENGDTEIVWSFNNGENDTDNRHKKQDHIQEQRFNFYVTSKVDSSLPEYSKSNFTPKWEEYVTELDRLVEMNHNQLMTPYEMEKATGILAKDIKKIFEASQCPLYKKSQIAKLKREKDFDKLYNYHFEEKMSLKEIYKKYGYSPPYIRKVFEDKGVNHLGFVNQIK